MCAQDVIFLEDEDGVGTRRRAAGSAGGCWAGEVDAVRGWEVADALVGGPAHDMNETINASITSSNPADARLPYSGRPVELLLVLLRQLVDRVVPRVQGQRVLLRDR